MTGGLAAATRSLLSTFYLQMFNDPKSLISDTILKIKYKKRMTF